MRTGKLPKWLLTENNVPLGHDGKLVIALLHKRQGIKHAFNIVSASVKTDLCVIGLPVYLPTCLTCHLPFQQHETTVKRLKTLVSEHPCNLVIVLFACVFFYFQIFHQWNAVTFVITKQITI